jgi:hypothetical protein
MNRKQFFLTLFSPILAVFGYKINIQNLVKKSIKFDPVPLIEQGVQPKPIIAFKTRYGVFNTKVGVLDARISRY